jgi:hypothetical protein
VSAQRIELTPQQVELLWEAGLLSWLLDANQLGIYDFLFSCGKKRVVLNCSRRIGKTFLLVLVAIEFALKHPRSIIKFAASTADDLEEIIIPIFDKILSTCPKRLEPRYRSQKQKYTFRNGSTIKLYGCDDRRKANRLRGTEAHLIIVEEAGSIPDLNYVVKSVLMPQLISTQGFLLFASTPPDSSGHEFVEIAEDAQRDGAYIHRTIYDCPRYTEEDRNVQFSMAAGSMPLEEYYLTEDYRREWLAEFITDASLAVLKHASEKHLGKASDKGYQDGTVTALFRTLERPEFFVPYEGGDFGWSPDKTGWLFGYWHHEMGALVVERELLVQRMDTDTLAKAIEALEKAWLGPSRSARYMHGYVQPRRWADADDRLLADLAGKHDLTVHKTKKDDRDTAINNLNLMIPGYDGRLAINPEGCPELLLQMKAAVWKNANRVDFSRTKRHAHFDLVAALIYMARNVVRGENPVPPGHGFNPRTHFRPDAPGPALSRPAMSLRQMLNRTLRR